MEYIKAIEKDIDAVRELVQETIETIYPKYYPAEVVDFFCVHHCKENIVLMGILAVLCILGIRPFFKNLHQNYWWKLCVI